jgi:predicted TIM-barrel fold metal-dependent hydrolase
MITDVNASLGHWPFQRFDVRTPHQLAAHLRKHGIGSAWVSAMDSVLHPDPEVHDVLLWNKLRPFRTLRFVKTVNPTLADWRESLDPWIKRRRVRIVKIFPNYHQYSLNDRCARELADRLSNGGIPLLVQMRLEDERGHYPLMKVPGVACPEVVDLAARFPALPVVALCAYRAELPALAAGPRNLCIDLSFVESLDTVKTALTIIPARRLLFGSHTPFLYTRSAVMKLEYASLPKKHRHMIACANALRIVGKQA